MVSLSAMSLKIGNCTYMCHDGVFYSGFLLPQAGEGDPNDPSQEAWPRPLRAILYIVALGWCFMGVAIVSDVFMGAIETITAKRKRVWDQKLNKFRTIHVWNDTVANLTLMALGSSAPEILLSLIEICSNDMYSGDLGPGTIVGSAAFNLMVISAVCVVAIPDGESRTIKDITVFAITSSCSVFAYLWLYFIVMGPSKNVIDIWEGVITFIFFPILVVLAFMADKGYFRRGGDDDDEMAKISLKRAQTVSALSKEQLAALEARILSESKVQLTDEQLAKIIEMELRPPKSRAQYRVGAVRKMVGGRRVSVLEDKKAPNKVVPVTVPHEEEEAAPHDDTAGKAVVEIQFESPTYAVMENVGSFMVPINLTVTAEGEFQPGQVTVEYKTMDGSATADTDYEPMMGKLVFEPGETQKQIEVKIVDDAAYEEDEEFYINLFNPLSSDPGTLVELGEHTTVTVMIIDDDLPGILSFETDDKVVEEEGKENTNVDIKVCRKGGCVGDIEVNYKTEGARTLLLQESNHFEEASDVLKLKHGQSVGVISLVLKPLHLVSPECFRVILSEPTGGAKFDAMRDGGPENAICTITVSPNTNTKSRSEKVFRMLTRSMDKAQIGHSSWKEQFHEALYVNGGEDDEDDEYAHPPSAMDWVMHIITLPWKLLFATVPPTEYCDGWLCFVCSLFMIGVVTALVGDIAACLGCSLGVPDSITAITFVALGTSLPDTFASKTAAEMDPHADASVGNVTGSNSVNVFLGLGLPWTLASIYWVSSDLKPKWGEKYPEQLKLYPEGGKFVVIGGDLGFNLVIFSLCAVTTIGTLMVRRKLWRAELGGPTLPKKATAVFFVFLWFLYIALSSWKVFDTRSKDPCYK